MVIQTQKRFADSRRRTKEGRELIGKFEEEDTIVALETQDSFEGVVKGIVYSVSNAYEQVYHTLSETHRKDYYACGDDYNFSTEICVSTELEGIKLPIPTGNFELATREDRKSSRHRIEALLTKLGKTCTSLDKDMNIYIALWESEQESKTKVKEYMTNSRLCYTALNL